MISPNHGTAGDLITLRGDTSRRGGKWSPSRIEVWWDEASPTEGKVIDGQKRLATFRAHRACRFKITLLAPAAPPGEHSIVLLIHHPGGYGIDPPVAFTSE